MAEYAPPTGPPPPKVPEGWKAVWNDQYSEWFYVNLYTKKSQWEKPTEPIYPPGEAPPDGPPPYQAPPASESEARTSMDKKTLGSNNPYAGTTGGTSSQPNVSDDERLARQLQEEENARARSEQNRGAADAFYAQGSTPQPGQYGGYPQQASPYPQNQSLYPQNQSPYADPGVQDKGKSKGFLGKLLGKSSSSSHQQHGYPQQYPQQGYGPPAGGYYGGQQGYYPQQQMYGGRPPKKHGLGAGGAAALGVGGGLLGGALLGEALADAGDHGDYGDDGGDFGGDGGDFGGDGGDFGGDF